MTGRFRGQRVLITGGSTGIGRAAVEAFAAEGARVIAVARSRERLEALSRQIESPPGLLPIVADITDGGEVDAMVARVLDDGGAPDVVVANAGLGLDARFVETTDEALRAVFELNVFGLFRTVRPFLPGMIERGSGRVLLISSVVGKRGIPRYAAYAASKFSLHGMADALRPELLGTGVTVGIVCPGSTTTEFHDRKLRHGTPRSYTRLARRPPESVARAILKMARSRRRETVLTPEGKLLAWVDLLAPGLVDRVLARFLR